MASRTLASRGWRDCAVRCGVGFSAALVLNGCGLAPAAPGGAAAPELQVVAVSDGDTIRVRSRSSGTTITVRLACIDAPEIGQGNSGLRASAQLQQLLEQGTLELRAQGIDRYGRTVAEVIAAGRNVNLEMVRSGQAYVYRRFLSRCDRGLYLAAEDQARRHRRGVWSGPNNEPRPWEFRQRQRTPARDGDG